MEQLSKDIIEFIEEYAKVSPNWDGDDLDGKYTGPDVYQLLMAVDLLKQGNKPTRVWSDWGSGCYNPYNSIEGKQKHNDLIKRISEI